MTTERDPNTYVIPRAISTLNLGAPIANACVVVHYRAAITPMSLSMLRNYKFS